MDEHTLNDLLECSVCLERLDDAKVLPCQHTFCRKCLLVIMANKNELRCPECRILVDLRVDDLPPNVLLMRILEGMKNSATKIQQSEMSLSNGAGDNVASKVDESMKINVDMQISLGTEPVMNSQPQQNQHAHMQPPKETQRLSQNHRFRQLTEMISSLTAPTFPHAIALYDFDSKEPNDLKFKKGDIILLKREVDKNWYAGQRNDCEGTFPKIYVKVLVPLPRAECIALYDFKMGPNEEEGCLSFKKNTVIHVLRRVDANWAEGRIGSTIGIFPIAFVNLNSTAKQLLGQLIKNVEVTQRNNVAITSAQQPQVQQAAQNLVCTVPNLPNGNNAAQINPCDSTSSSSSSSHNNSPNSTTCSSLSSTNSMPGSPNHSLPNTPEHSMNTVKYRNPKEKRHSLNALLINSGFGATTSSSTNNLQMNRHSAEILSAPSEMSEAAASAVSASVGNGLHSLRIQRSFINFDQDFSVNVNKPVKQSMSAREQQQTASVPEILARTTLLKTSSQQFFPASLPWGHLALYPYTPRMSDELELKKGCIYIVTERCPDGWVKGKNWLDQSGVFPGNYVTPLRNRDQQQLMHQYKCMPLHNHSAEASNNMDIALMQHNSLLVNGLPQQAPDLPQRSLYYMDAETATTSASSSSAAWNKPLTHNTFNPFNHMISSHPHAVDTGEIEAARQNDPCSANVNTSGTTASMSAFNLMKRFAKMNTRSKSPNTAANQEVNSTNNHQHQQQQTSHPIYATNEQPPNYGMSLHNQINPNVPTQVQHVHVRSGSCPSQLLQNIPVNLTVNENSKHNMQQQQHYNQQLLGQTSYGSQRIKGCKERTPLPCALGDRFTKYPTQNGKHTIGSIQQIQNQLQQKYAQKCEAANAINHRKSQSLDANTLPMPMQALNMCLQATAAPSKSNNIIAPLLAACTANQNVQDAPDRYRCVVPYPPNSDFELELHVGDIIYVHRKQKTGWYKGLNARSNKVGLFPASFVEPDI
ncbi:E3 ubiquitin-protein ligase SH3RF1 [Teleopsis dalmanni]|uniref:E3 ubiquitin-protein ligase SH3RF1 n=1 Tax=Teleopsis dalmanni TaxID=139649 RepID=UPI0018CEDED9|nr:E3 ubiquitin-protein ligase SH3RF1 [Teleopsis dalmanni]